jgi:hypothetical protein
MELATLIATLLAADAALRLKDMASAAGVRAYGQRPSLARQRSVGRPDVRQRWASHERALTTARIFVPAKRVRIAEAGR